MNDYEDNTAYNEEELPVSSNQITSRKKPQMQWTPEKLYFLVNVVK